MCVGCVCVCVCFVFFRVFHFYFLCILSIQVDERLRQAVDSVSKAARLLVKMQNFDRALEVLKKELDMYVELEQEGKIHKVNMSCSLGYTTRRMLGEGKRQKKERD